MIGKRHCIGNRINTILSVLITYLFMDCDAAAVGSSSIPLNLSKKKIQNAIKNKLSTYCLRWDPSVFCTKTQMSCLNQTGQSECPFTPFVLIDDRLECMDGLCQKVNTHLYNASSVDKIAAVIVF